MSHSNVKTGNRSKVSYTVLFALVACCFTAYCFFSSLGETPTYQPSNTQPPSTLCITSEVCANIKQESPRLCTESWENPYRELSLCVRLEKDALGLVRLWVCFLLSTWWKTTPADIHLLYFFFPVTELSKAERGSTSTSWCQMLCDR